MKYIMILANIIVTILAILFIIGIARAVFRF